MQSDADEDYLVNSHASSDQHHKYDPGLIVTALVHALFGWLEIILLQVATILIDMRHSLA